MLETPPETPHDSNEDDSQSDERSQDERLQDLCLFESSEGGYIGHIPYSDVIEQGIPTFYEMVMNEDTSKGLRGVKKVLSTLLPDDDMRSLNHLSRLCIDRSSAEPTKEALLSAICIGNRALVEHILQLFHDFPHEEQNGCMNSSMFGPHITPLILACINNNFAIVETLLLRGHSIVIPHHSQCACIDCSSLHNSSFEHIRKVDVYRAISSEAYLWLATSDPFAAACAVVTDIKRIIRDESIEFIDTYNLLLSNVQHFAVRLMEQCWKVEEVDLFLSQPNHSRLLNCHTQYPRIRMALDSSMKNFLACSSVQRTLNALWWKGWGNFNMKRFRDFTRVFRHSLLYPIISFIFIIIDLICPKSRVASSCRVPLARFISYTSSYVIFLGSVVGVRIIKDESDELYDRDMSMPSWKFILEIYMFVHAAGLLLDRYIEFSKRGYQLYFSLWWRWFDFLFLEVFMLAFYFWITSIVKGLSEVDSLKNLQRQHCTDYDTFIIYDIFLAFGSVLAFWKCFYFFQLNKYLGPTIISVGRCVTKILSYVFVITLIMASFGVGLNILASPYEGIIVYEEGKKKESTLWFSSIPRACSRLYWAIFGYMDPEHYPIFVGKSGPEEDLKKHEMIAYAVEGMSMVYHSIVIVTLLNLMISLLVKKAEEVLENEDVEFKYTRACIYAEFNEDSISVPPPFNIVYIGLKLVKNILIVIFSWCKCCICCKEKEHTVYGKWFEGIFCLQRIGWIADREYKYPSEEKLEDQSIVYENLLRVMFHRYRANYEATYTSVFRSAQEKEITRRSTPKLHMMNDTLLYPQSANLSKSRSVHHSQTFSNAETVSVHGNDRVQTVEEE